MYAGFTWGWRIAFIPFALAVSGVLAFIAGYKTGRAKATNSLLFCQRVPLVLGEPFRGHIVANVPAVPSEGFWLELKCVKHGADSGDVTVLWEDQQLVHPTEPFQIPFAFELPADGMSSGQAIRWFLDVTAPGYSVSFSLPVTEARSPAAARS